MSFLNSFRNLAAFLRRKYNLLQEYFIGPSPAPDINVIIVHVSKITLDPKDTIDGVSSALGPEQFKEALAAAAAREAAVLKHNMRSDTLLRNPRSVLEEDATSWFATILSGSTIAVIVAGTYFLAPGIVSMGLLGNALSFGVGLFVKSYGFNTFFTSLLSLFCRLLLRFVFARFFSKSSSLFPKN